MFQWLKTPGKLPPGWALLPPDKRPPVSSDSVMVPALLQIRLAVSVRDYRTRAWDRYRRSLVSTGPQWGTPARTIRREDIQAGVVPNYDKGHRVTSVSSYPPDLNSQCDYYLQAADLEYQAQAPQDRTYMGLRDDISPDGAIQQVTWQTGPQGATTRASRNTEWNPAVPSYLEQRQLQRLQQVARQAPELLSKVRRLDGRQPPRGNQ